MRVRGGFSGLLAALSYGIVDELDANPPRRPRIARMTIKAQHEIEVRRCARRKRVARQRRE